MPYVSMAAMMETGQWYKWPISSPENDEASPGVMDLILENAVRSPISEGELLVVAKGDHLLKLEQRILELIRARCHLEPVETRTFHAVYRMEACAQAGEEDRKP